VGSTAVLRGIDEEKYIPLVENDNRSLDRSECYKINTLNPLLTVDTQNAIISFNP